MAVTARDSGTGAGRRLALAYAEIVGGNTVDVVTKSLLSEFATSQKIDGTPISDQFEAFINYIIVSDVYSEEFDFGGVATGLGEFGIDGIAILVNDALIDDE